MVIEIEVKVPIRIEITKLHITRGSHSWNAPSDVDYHGGIDELEYTVLDHPELVDYIDEEVLHEAVYEEFERITEHD